MIFTGPSGYNRVCTIYSPNVITNGAMMNIPSGTQNVILYCICRRGDDNVAIGPAIWTINGNAVTTTARLCGNKPYTRNNSVPSPLIIPSFTADSVGTYRCVTPVFESSSVATIALALSGMYM